MFDVPNRSLDPTLSQLQTWAALAGGVALVALGVRRGPVATICCGAVGAALIHRGLRDVWPNPRTSIDESRPPATLPQRVHVRESVRVQRPVDDVYRYWRELQNLPAFMAHVERVDDLGGGRSEWTGRGPAGIRVVWRADIVHDVPNEAIAWRSIPPSDLDVDGAVTFASVRDGATQVTVRLQYDPPAGAAGNLIARLFGHAPTQTVREDLRRLKQLLEGREIARARASRPQIVSNPADRRPAFPGDAGVEVAR